MSVTEETQKLERTYPEVFGPVSPSSIGANRYAISFIDQFSGYAVAKIMEYKTQVLQAFEEHVAQYNRRKILRNDKATEYKTKPSKNFA